jgi:hypothetical protein
MSSRPIGIRAQTGRYGFMFEAYPETAARERHARGRADHFTLTLEACRY